MSAIAFDSFLHFHKERFLRLLCLFVMANLFSTLFGLVLCNQVLTKGPAACIIHLISADGSSVTHIATQPVLMTTLACSWTRSIVFRETCRRDFCKCNKVSPPELLSKLRILLFQGHYCKSGNFRVNFIFADSVKRHICEVKISPLGHDLPRSVNDSVISPFREDFIFTKLRICEVSRKLNPRENFQIYSMSL